MTDQLQPYREAAAKKINCAPEELLAFRFDSDDRQFVALDPAGQKHRFEIKDLTEHTAPQVFDVIVAPGIGWLWYCDGDAAHPLAVRLVRAVQAFQKRFGRVPTMAHVNAAQWPDAPATYGVLVIVKDKTTQHDHIELYAQSTHTFTRAQ